MTVTAPPPTAAACRDLFPGYPIPAAETALTELAIARSNGLSPMVGERTPLPGLALTPHAAGDVLRYTGTWVLTHVSSGRRVSPAASFLRTHEAVLWLENTGVDWDRPMQELHADPSAEAAFGDLYFAMHRAQDAGRPLVYARTSWAVRPPLWRIRHRGVDSAEGFETFEDAAALAEVACEYPDSELILHPDAVILRDLQPAGWGLRCSSIGCAGGETWIPDDWTGNAATGTRAQLAARARAGGWVEHDPGHWTCPACACHYPQTWEV
ncbi:hypothetical protein DMH03_23900 [Amycolatopsis sp. WAC 01376]|uniref:hypothetical protein n=1 Tax=Amycolatopsis sp. WAC 01376 TaxID=2203195 RepID=UPI000F78C290|nr:hypothetical protein [Amycolatopsis sp. WAC 01376]RSM58946.1 hypothetical protein DMH03_23900 [Amycolatopsis sp. WAC 01376]